jgi:NADH-ubiquinone oxidoreductase chain 2
MLFVNVIILLLVNAVTLRRERTILLNWLAILILRYSVALLSIGVGIRIYGGLFQSTSIVPSFNLFVSILGAIVLLLTAFYPRRFKEPYPSGEGQQFFLIPRQKITSVFTEYSKYTYSYLEIYKNKIINKMGEQFTIIEYPLIILFILIGATFLMSSSDLVSMFLAIELQSYGLYIFATLYRDSELATSAGLTYFLLGGLSACFILLGYLLYLNSGITNLDGLYFFEQTNGCVLSLVPLAIYIHPKKQKDLIPSSLFIFFPALTKRAPTKELGGALPPTKKEERGGRSLKKIRCISLNEFNKR